MSAGNMIVFVEVPHWGSPAIYTMDSVNAFFDRALDKGYDEDTYGPLSMDTALQFMGRGVHSLWCFDGDDPVADMKREAAMYDGHMAIPVKVLAEDF